MDYKEIIEKAQIEGRKTLSEYESKEIIREFGITLAEEIFVRDISELSVISNLSFPLVAKGISKGIAHKTERNLVRLWIKNEAELKKEVEELKGVEGVEGVLISRQIIDRREFLLGLKYDIQFGYAILFGLGGIFTEALKDISIRICPITKGDAGEMLLEVKSSALLKEIRGFKAVNIERLKEMMVNLSKIPEKIQEISEVDINPIMFEDGEPVAVDALVVLK